MLFAFISSTEGFKLNGYHYFIVQQNISAMQYILGVKLFFDIISTCYLGTARLPGITLSVTGKTCYRILKKVTKKLKKSQLKHYKVLNRGPLAYQGGHKCKIHLWYINHLLQN